MSLVGIGGRLFPLRRTMVECPVVRTQAPAVSTAAPLVLCLIIVLTCVVVNFVERHDSSFVLRLGVGGLILHV
jgi:hypothetical protein